MRSVVFARCALVFAAVSMALHAQDYPSKPITIVIGYPPGGGADTVARVIQQSASNILGKRILVENRPGASGRAGTDHVARAKPDDPRLAERVELYVSGLELANGFGELIDAARQRARFEADMDVKGRLYGERYPIDEDFLEAIALMPPTSGIALGFDRLVMLALGVPRIDDVLWTPLAPPSENKS